MPVYTSITCKCLIGRRHHEFILDSKELVLYLMYNHILVMSS